MTKIATKKLIATLFVSGLLAVAFQLATQSKAYAQSCEPTYGGGQDCTSTQTFDVSKKVRIEGSNDDSWNDKVTDVKEGDVVEFKIEVKNTGNVEVDGMKMTDSLPDEMYKTGGDGLTESWDNFEPGETQTFIIQAKVNASEFDAANFDKCVVNKVKVEQDGDTVGTAAATVCYSNAELTELPQTGDNSLITFAVIGFGLIALGLLIKKSNRFAR